ncbi:MAG: VTT domain-containing protein [Patescibacteria group bacterium]
MELFVNSILGLLYEHRYIFSFIGALFEGTYTLILAGVLLKFGFFNFFGLFAVLFVGYYINGIFFYLLGYFGGKNIIDKFIKKFHLTRKILEKIEKYFEKHVVKTIFISRITLGTSIFVLMIAGSLKIKKKTVLITTFFASIVWILSVLIIGYSLGLGYKAVGDITQKIAKGLAIGVIIFLIIISIVLIAWLRKITKLKFFKNLEDHKFAFFRKIGRAINKMNNNN